MRRRLFAALPAAVLLFMATSVLAAPANDDPAEHMNRVGFAIYEVLDRAIFRPAAMVYVHVVPPPIRIGLAHVISNLHEPVVAANDLMQGRLRKARSSLVRFAVNSTAGVAGLLDVATRIGVPHHDNGFALTLGRAGVRPGPFLFLPIGGPTTVRDAVGDAVDGLMDPLQWFVGGAKLIVGPRLTELVVTKNVVSGLDERSNADQALDAVLADATDPYATLRSLYLQNQQAKIDDVPPGALPVLPAFDDQPASQPTARPTASLGVDGQTAVVDGLSAAGGLGFDRGLLLDARYIVPDGPIAWTGDVPFAEQAAGAAGDDRANLVKLDARLPTARGHKTGSVGGWRFFAGASAPATSRPTAGFAAAPQLAPASHAGRPTTTADSPRLAQFASSAAESTAPGLAKVDWREITGAAAGDTLASHRTHGLSDALNVGVVPCSPFAAPAAFETKARYLIDAPS